MLKMQKKTATQGPVGRSQGPRHTHTGTYPAGSFPYTKQTSPFSLAPRQRIGKFNGRMPNLSVCAAYSVITIRLILWSH